MLITTLATLCIAAQPTPSDVPDWVIRGMLRTETSSTLRPDGTVHRRDHGNDRDSLGCLQMRRIAWEDVKKHFPNRVHADLEKDDQLAILAAKYYLCRYYRKETGWEGAVMSYNVGPFKLSPLYLKKVKQP